MPERSERSEFVSTLMQLWSLLLCQLYPREKIVEDVLNVFIGEVKDNITSQEARAHLDNYLTNTTDLLNACFRGSPVMNMIINECVYNYQTGVWEYRVLGVLCPSGYRVRIAWMNGHFCIYIGVPVNHALFGKSHEMFDFGATYSRIAEQNSLIPSSDDCYWEFGFDFAGSHIMTPDNIIRCLKFDHSGSRITELEIVTISYIRNRIIGIMFYFSDLHQKAYGTPFPGLRKPGSGKQRKRYHNKRVKAGYKHHASNQFANPDQIKSKKSKKSEKTSKNRRA